MKEVFGNAWQLGKDYDFICITTNGMVKNNGEAVMGRGIAAQFKTKYPFGPAILGAKINKNGNIYQPIMWNDQVTFMSFPVKHHWAEKADFDLIVKSTLALREHALKEKNKKFLLPRPGCGNGSLNWNDVKQKIEDLLPDNVFVVHFEKD